ncbi:MAG: zinc ribbon domain-containing protein [Anaerolineae bacterium]|nr:zinc ribbon domain-containing protein [Anaerolineae bacterium]
MTKQVHKRNRWLAYGAILTGTVIVVLLVVALNRGPIARGFEPEGGGIGIQAFCSWCQEGRSPTVTDLLGMVLIGLVVFALPAGHLALLIMLAARAGRPPKFSDIEPAYHCPHCNHPLVKQWRNCPYCGVPIERPRNPST